jgi:hypothetical protein
MKRRIMNFKDQVSPEIFKAALDHKPAINTGVVAFRKDNKFLPDWIDLAIKTNGLCFISDEISFQVLYPSYQGIFIAPSIWPSENSSGLLTSNIKEFAASF